MKEIRLIVADDPARTGEYCPVDIVIDGRRLIDVLKRIETPYADEEGSPEIAGQYHSLTTCPESREPRITLISRIFSSVPIREIRG